MIMARTKAMEIVMKKQSKLCGTNNIEVTTNANFDNCENNTESHYVTCRSFLENILDIP